MRDYPSVFEEPLSSPPPHSRPLCPFSQGSVPRTLRPYIDLRRQRSHVPTPRHCPAVPHRSVYRTCRSVCRTWRGLPPVFAGLPSASSRLLERRGERRGGEGVTSDSPLSSGPDRVGGALGRGARWAGKHLVLCRADGAWSQVTCALWAVVVGGATWRCTGLGVVGVVRHKLVLS